MTKRNTFLKTMCFVLLTVLLSHSNLFAQPRVDQYLSVPFSGALSTIVGGVGTVNIGMSGQISGEYAYAVPFNFIYDGTTYAQGSTLYINSQGSVTFGAAYYAYYSYPDPYTPYSGQPASYYQKSICPFSGLLNTGSVYYQVSGVAPNRVLTVEWNAMKNYWATATTLTFQLKMYETSNVIEFIYGAYSLTMGANNYNLSSGINGASSPSFKQKIVFGNSTNYTSPPTNYRLSIPPNIQLWATPKTIDFGAQIAGTNTDRLIRLTHVGTEGTLDIASATISGTNASDFTIFSPVIPPTGIPVGGFVDYTIRYNPTAPGIRTAVITFISNGRDSGTQSVTLNGFGIAPQIDVQPTILFKNVRVANGDSLVQFVVISSTSVAPLFFTNYPNSFVFSGPGAADYSVSQLPRNPINGGTNDTLWIKLKPTAEGGRPAILTIYNNSTNNPAVQIILKGIGIIPRAEVSPTVRMDFDSVTLAGTKICKPVSIYNLGSDTLRITKQYFSSQDGDFTMDVLTGQQLNIAPLATRTFNICFAPLQNGTRQARLRMLTNIPKTNDGRDTGFIELEIRGNGVAYGTLSGIAITRDTVKVGMSICRTDTIWNTGFYKIDVNNVMLSGPDASAFQLSGVTAPFTIIPKGYVTYTVCTTPAVIGSSMVSVNFTGITNEKPVTFTAAHNVESTIAKSQIAPPALFSTVSILKDTKRTETVTVSNTGTLSSTYSATIIKGVEYSFDAADAAFTLEPGMTKTIVVTFAPTSKGLKNGMLRISATDQNDVLIPMSGSGFENQASSGVALTESEGFRLEQNYPNPTTGSTNFSFTVPTSTNVRIVLADVTGNVIKELANGRFEQGTHQVSVSTRDISSGNYLYILDANGVRLTRVMVVTK